MNERLRLLVQQLSPEEVLRPREIPSSRGIGRLVEIVRALVFPELRAVPAESVHNETHRLLRSLTRELEDLIGAALTRRPDAAVVERGVDALVDSFLDQLPSLRECMASDVRSALRGDPALESEDEAVLCYPGVQAVLCHRIAHALHRHGVPLLPRMIAAHAQSQTGVDIHPGAVIGRGFFIDHGTGVVIGETAVIGDGVRIYQGVTLGTKSFRVDDAGVVIKGEARHPILEDDVVVYAGATILGRVTIGRGSVIGGSVWLTRDVPAGSFVTQTPSRRSTFTGGAGI